MENNKKNNNKNTLSILDKRNIILNMANAYKDKFEQDRPTTKTDLTFSEIKELCYLNNNTKDKFLKLLLEDKINPRNKLSKWSNDCLVIFKDDFSELKRVENIEDKRLIVAKAYEDWIRVNEPKNNKRITASTITIHKYIDMLKRSKKSIDINKLYDAGMNSLSWRISHLNIEALSVLEKALN